ncbi:precorrin-3B synthase [Ornithinimicrobium humiphilum]|uniref:Precorrin-3B synthase n=1 Tax=Ornithinimicrobium humiphilum TaxID=125288 RepID=A0A543KNK2_9MICO|nr:nitrite reductase [Ornithinimicrobium humiphilum]TQM96645.1 precorrin-3B synthase [Ornithinimicrobium humiphilum]
MTRSRPDRCPGALRPWPADDGLLVRLRLPGGNVSADALLALVAVAERYGDGHVHVTTRTNLQVRGLPAKPGTTQLAQPALAAIEDTGLLPSRTHDLARNVMASPQTGLFGGRADLRPVVRALDAALLAEPALGALPGRFLFVLDDGRGDLLDRTCDLGLVALGPEAGQLRIGTGWGPVLPLVGVEERLVGLALRFLDARGGGPRAPWHVHELPVPLVGPVAASGLLPHPSPPLPYGTVPGGQHVPVPEDGLDRPAVERLCAAAPALVVTPWRGVLVPQETL